MKAELYHNDDDTQIFKHYLELCDNDPVRAFTAYREQFIVPLLQEIRELKEKAKRRQSDSVSDINHFIDFVKGLWLGDDINFQSYDTYCQRERIKPKFKDSKFYELRPLAIKRILIDELPRHFSSLQAEALLKEKEWRIPSKYIEEALADDGLFVEFPMNDQERREFFQGSTDDDSPIYGKAFHP